MANHVTLGSCKSMPVAKQLNVDPHDHGDTMSVVRTAGNFNPLKIIQYFCLSFDSILNAVQLYLCKQKSHKNAPFARLDSILLTVVHGNHM